MQSLENQNICPKCHSREFKSWDEIDRDEKIVAECLPKSAQYQLTTRKKHRFCTRCWFEETERTIDLA